MDRFEFTVPVRPRCTSENLKSARDAVSRLSAEEKATFLQEILGQGHQVILGGGNLINANVVVQIQSGNVDLSEVFTAAAHRVSKEQQVERGSN